jgi:acetolactate synthase-1/2/3 large subunit
MAPKRADVALAEALKAEGVQYVFGLPGGHSVRILYDAIRDDPAIEAILARHETGGAFAALGYAQVTGGPAVCHGTAGPGWGQTIVGVHEAWAARIPLVCLVAAAPAADYGKGALQEFPQYESMLDCTKWAYRVDRAEKVPWVMRQAFKHALAPPTGPVFVELPIDIPGQLVETPDYIPAPRVRAQANPADVEAAVRLIAQAKRPIIVAGRGVHQAQAHCALRLFAEQMHLPVLTTNGGKTAIREDHPLYAGGVGCNATSVSDAFMSTTDCMFWIGSQIEGPAVHPRGRRPWSVRAQLCA